PVGGGRHRRDRQLLHRLTRGRSPDGADVLRDGARGWSASHLRLDASSLQDAVGRNRGVAADHLPARADPRPALDASSARAVHVHQFMALTATLGVLGTYILVAASGMLSFWRTRAE